MRLGIVGISLLITGCVTGAVSPAGKDSYIVSATRCGICEPVQGYVMRIASEYCVAKGRNLQIRNFSGNNAQPMFPGSATLMFSCLSSDDPEYGRPNLRKEPDTVIEDQRH